ncbi:hypothetical protein Emag_001114 [Eimeria magna]
MGGWEHPPLSAGDGADLIVPLALGASKEQHGKFVTHEGTFDLSEDVQGTGDGCGYNLEFGGAHRLFRCNKISSNRSSSTNRSSSSSGSSSSRSSGKNKSTAAVRNTIERRLSQGRVHSEAAAAGGAAAGGAAAGRVAARAAAARPTAFFFFAEISKVGLSLITMIHRRDRSVMYKYRPRVD